MIARIAIVFALVAGCGDPPLKLVYRPADTGGGYSCGTSAV